MATMTPQQRASSVVTRAMVIMTCWTAGVAFAASGCPPTHKTPPAPPEYAALHNPLPASRDNLAAGKKLYRAETSCVACHGKEGDGAGVLAEQFAPPPRDFTCPTAMTPASDGQLFWVIRHGSDDTAMPPHLDLSDTQIWQLVLYVRQFRRPDASAP